MSRKERSNGREQAQSNGERPAVEDRTASIARLAYEKWQARGCPVGDDCRDWFEAEQEVAVAAGARPDAPSSSARSQG